MGLYEVQMASECNICSRIVSASQNNGLLKKKKIWIFYSALLHAGRLCDMLYHSTYQRCAGEVAEVRYSIFNGRLYLVQPQLITIQCSETSFSIH